MTNGKTDIHFVGKLFYLHNRKYRCLHDHYSRLVAWAYGPCIEKNWVL